MKIRIQKALAEAGIASRRAAEEMILEGRVTVNGELVMEIPFFVDPVSDDIRVDNQPVAHKAPKKVYFLLNKPRGVICTQSDPQGRPRAVDMVPASAGRVYCIGRLDVESTGLIILTNDGDLTQHLTHPSHGVEKTYVVEVEGHIEHGAMEKLKAGVFLDGKRTRGAKLKILSRGRERSLLEFRLSESRNREVRRMLARVGHKVRRLKRTGIAGITDKGLKIGHWRMLTPREVKLLLQASGESPTKS